MVVQSVPTREAIGYQLGGGQWIYTDCYLHIFATNEPSRDNLLDILTYQFEKKFFFFNKNAIKDSGAFPLNQFGYLVNQSSNYPYLVNNYLWRYAIIKECTGQSVRNNSQSISSAVCKWRMMIEFADI